jgi:hypothetical protein
MPEARNNTAKKASVHFITLFVGEKHNSVMLGNSSGDKAYLMIRREAKVLLSALNMFFGRKGVVK